ncbi:MAG TPA: ABC transporter permease [Longimicrobiales bacterium]|nr:ABC transporter permease [Longimicrobiales bacterium]
MWQILLSEFWDDLRSQRTRVILTGVGIACGTFIVVVLLALGEGIKRTMMSELLSAYDAVIIMYAGQTSQPYRGLPARRGIRFEEDDVAALLREVPDLIAASSVYSRSDVRLTVAGSRQGQDAQVQGVDASYARLKNITAAPGGRFLNDRDVAERRRVVFLADSLARMLFPAGDALGNAVRMNNQPFMVIGIAPRRVQTSLEFNDDATLAVIPSSTFSTVYNQRNPRQIVLRARDPQDSEGVQQGVRRVLADRHRFDAADESALYMNDWAEEAREVWRILTGIQVFMGLVGGLTLLVAAVGVANIMYVAVKERTLEIGIKLALGARSYHIVAQFVFEAVLLSMAGGLAGLAAARVAVAIVNGVNTDNQVLEYLLKPVISWHIGLATVLILTIIGFMAGVFPARRAAALDPVESLRYE